MVVILKEKREGIGMRSTKVEDPELLKLLNSKSATKVTDPELLKKLNAPEKPKHGFLGKIFNPREGDYPGAGSVGAFARSGREGLLTGAENIVDFLPALLGHPVVNRKAQFPEGFRREPEDIKHPFASLYGGASSAGALGGSVAGGATKAIPALQKLASAGFLPGLGAGTVGGGVLGGLMSNPGERVQGAGEGALLGGSGYLLHDLLKSIPGGIKWLKQFGTTKDLKKKVASTQKQLEEAKKSYLPAIEQEDTTHAKNEMDYQALKDMMEQNPLTGSANPNAITRKANTKAQEQEQLLQHMNQVPEELKATEPPQSMLPQAPRQIPETQPEMTALEVIPKTQVDEELLPAAESYLKTKEQKAAEAEEKFATEHLKKGQAHKRTVGRKVNKAIEQKQNEIGGEYKRHEKGLEKEHITIETTPENNKLALDILERIKKEEPNAEGIDELNKDLKGNALALPANRVVSAYRTVRNLAKKTRASAYGESPQEFDRITAKADQLDEDAKMLESMIDKGLANGAGKKYLTKLHATNKRYATEIAPLFNEPMYQHLLKNNKMPSGMLEQLSKEPFIRESNPNKATGMGIINDIIKKDPEAVAHVLGEEYANKPAKIHDYHELTQEMLPNASQEFHEARQEHWHSMKEAEQAKAQHAEAKEMDKTQRAEAKSKDDAALAEAKERYKEAKKESEKIAKQKTNEANKAEKERVEKENKEAEESYKQQKLYHENHLKVLELDSEIQELRESAAKIKEASKKARRPKSGTGLKEIASLEKEVKDIEAKIAKRQADKTKLLLGLGRLGLTAAAGYGGTKLAINR
jgi:hypothetical protein